MRRVEVFGIGLGLFLLALSPAVAEPICEVDKLAPPGTDPAVIRGAIQISPGCTLDFNGRHVVLLGTLFGGGFTLRGGAFTLAETGTIQAGIETIEILVQRNALHDGSAVLDGVLSGIGDGGGSFLLQADGSVIVAATALIESRARLPAGSGGFLGIEAGLDLTIEKGAVIQSLAGPDGFGGEVLLRSLRGAVSQGGAIQAAGGGISEGAVAIEAGAGIELRGPIVAPGACQALGCWKGGHVAITAGGGIALSAPINARGADGLGTGGDGDGGEVLLDAVGDIIAGETVDLSGGMASKGGLFSARTQGNYFQKSGSVLVHGRFGDSSGGIIRIVAEGDVDLFGTYEAGGGLDGYSGLVEISATTDILVSGSILNAANFPAGKVELISTEGAITARGRIDASGRGPLGTGGEIGLYSRHGLNLDGAVLDASGAGTDGLGGKVILDTLQGVNLAARSSVLASGDPVDAEMGEGGLVDVLACFLDAQGETKLQAAGAAGGTIFFVASFGVSFPSIVDAGKTGLVTCRYPLGQKPDLNGATVIPPAVLEPQPDLDPCFETPPCSPVEQLACRLVGFDVALSWQRSFGQSLSRVKRDGVLLAELAVEVEVYTDLAPPPGTHAYTVEAICGSGAAPEAACRATVPRIPQFMRGDCNVNKRLEIADPIGLLFHLFHNDPATLPCDDACDGNDDGKLNLADAIRMLETLFTTRGGPLPAPYEECGPDKTTEDPLGCREFSICQ